MDLFRAELDEIVNDYPRLNIVENGLQVFLSGELSIYDESICLLDTYELEIHPASEYPYKFPIVYEIGSKIPRNIDWHIYEGKGNCCIKVMPEETIICLEGITLKLFIEQQLKPYLFNQTFRRENGYFINERSHGVKGLIEYFSGILLTSDIKKIEYLLGYILFKDELSRVADCFCGSGRKYRKCHRDGYRLLSKIGREDLLLYLKAIMKHSTLINK
ncbi:hypothetical protein AAKU52_003204 [Pedobacter sp. CG_S7]|uniref:SEC-C domain-containing protein n=1 Tax=Pedobacter sp. CG_S7 TaxID=3143930 RepID=UPI003391376B